MNRDRSVKNVNFDEHARGWGKSVRVQSWTQHDQSLSLRFCKRAIRSARFLKISMNHF